MHRIIIYGSVLILLIHLSGCFPVLIPSDEPEEFSASKGMLESLKGSTRDEVKHLIGQPNWIVHADGKEYYVYQWSSAATWMTLIGGVIPDPFVTKDYGKGELHCILLVFSENNSLNNYKIVNRIYSRDCLVVFGLQEKAGLPTYSSSEMLQVTQIIGLYCQRAELGDVDAQQYLGDLYFYGLDGMQKDLIRAYVWYRFASITGSREAENQLDLVENELSPSQLSEAKRLFKDWKPGQCRSDLLKAVSANDE